MRIFNVEEAQQSILKRRVMNWNEYSQETIRRTEDIFGKGVTPYQAVEIILKSVEEEGDNAVRKWSQRLDAFFLCEEISIQPSYLEEAWNQLPKKIQEAMRIAVDRIRGFHQNQSVRNWITSDMGGELGQRVIPIGRVGIYVPGGTAPLPSSLLMSVIPAQVAGVKQVIVTTPPKPDITILGAAFLCGIQEFYQVGGAQAIAAMAFGTETIKRVDKIFGPGNLFVTLAKQQLFGVVGMDGLAGPTETMVIADQIANPAWVAADLLAQAEHDVLASAILLTPDFPLAEAVQQEVIKQIDNLSRKEIIRKSIEYSGGIVVTDTLEQAAQLADAYAPEHLCLSVEQPKVLMEMIGNAGGFFLGEHSFEVLGDYVAGPSHVMPTGGTARFASPLNVLDFVKISSVIGLDKDTSLSLCKIAIEMAELEKLTAHASAARARMEGI